MLKYCNLFLIVCLIFVSCHEQTPPDKPIIVSTPEEMNDAVSSNIQSALSVGIKNGGKINNSISVRYPEIAQTFYKNINYKPVWSNNENLNSITDSLLKFIDQSRYYGLFPQNYHQSSLEAINSRFQTDTLALKDATLWTRFDLLCTDAFFNLLKDLREGRLVVDSLSITHKKNDIDSFFVRNLNLVVSKMPLRSVMDSAQPTYTKYVELKDALKDFVDSMDTTYYIPISYPFDDSLRFVKKVYDRLLQEGIGDSDLTEIDSLSFSKAIKRYQKKHGLEADGKIGSVTVQKMNQNDEVRFLNAAITLDKFRKFHNFPDTYIMVNIPAFSLEVWDHDSLLLKSKTIVGKPKTPTPELTSQINNMVIYPTWTIPTSIIKKDILPQLKKDPGYLKKKGYNLFTEKGDLVDPYSVNWAKYKFGIPYKIVQGSGDDNALGIFKFNFSNPFSVYLHDTNERYLFANAQRALSHGCVRVQQWKQLADIITERDSTLYITGHLGYSMDSINKWIADGSRKSIMIRNKYPLYILYLTCGTQDGRIHFYNDIYGEDQKLAGLYSKQSI